MEPNVIPAAEAARRKGCTTQAIYNAVERGALNGLRVGTSRLVALDAKWDAYAVLETGGRLHRTYHRNDAEGR